MGQFAMYVRTGGMAVMILVRMYIAIWLYSLFTTLWKIQKYDEKGLLPMRDEWSGFADLLANLIEMYAMDLDLDSLPEPDKEQLTKYHKKESVQTLENEIESKLAA